MLDTVLGLRDPGLGGCSDLVTIIGLNHYRDSTLPPFHQFLINAQKRWTIDQAWEYLLKSVVHFLLTHRD